MIKTHLTGVALKPTLAGSVGVLCALFLLIAASSAPAHNGDLLSEYGTANVNGVIAAGEYEDGCVGPIGQAAGTTSYQITVCEQNNEQNDYYAVKISDLTNDDAGPNQIGDGPMIWFDNDHSGTVTTSGTGCTYGQPDEDAIGLLFGVFFDAFYCRDPEGFTFGGDFEIDGAVQRQFTAGQGWVFEFSHPLDSGDPDDYSLLPHDEVGWCLTYDDKSNSPPNNPGHAFGELQYPAGCFVDFSNQTLGLVRGDATLLGDVRKQNAFDESLEKLKDKLKRLVATCKFCPPDPTAKYRDKINEVIKFLIKEQKPKSLKALKSVFKQTKSFVRSGDMPGKKGKQFLKLAKVQISQLKKSQTAKSLPTAATPGGLHANQIKVGPDGGRPPVRG